MILKPGVEPSPYGELVDWAMFAIALALILVGAESLGHGWRGGLLGTGVVIAIIACMAIGEARGIRLARRAAKLFVMPSLFECLLERLGHSQPELWEDFPTSALEAAVKARPGWFPGAMIVLEARRIAGIEG